MDRVGRHAGLARRLTNLLNETATSAEMSDTQRSVHRSTRRLFLAAWPNADVRAQLASLVEQCAACGQGRAIPAENLHLTLAFLGDLPQERIGEIEELAERLEPAPVQMSLDRFGHFSHHKHTMCCMPDVPRMAGIRPGTKQIP